MSKNLTLKMPLLLIVLIASAALGQQRTSSASTNRQQSGSDATTVFRSARDLITDGEWAKAQEKFSEYVSTYPNEKNIDAALYWLAYTQNKLAKYDQCRSTIHRLLEKYPNSSWREDARVLLAQVPGSYVVAYQDLAPAIAKSVVTALPAIDGAVVYAPGATTIAPVAITPVTAQGVGTNVWSLESNSDDNDPCEFKIVVLQALFQTDLQRGIVAATDWLKPGSTQTVR